MRDKNASVVARVRAIGELLDRGCGRPAQALAITGDLEVAPRLSPIEIGRRMLYALSQIQQPGKVLEHKVDTNVGAKVEPAPAAQAEQAPRPGAEQKPEDPHSELI
jgi:hypothetical protein